MSPFTSMKLIFLKTGDELHFQETNNEFLEYYLDKLDSNNIFIPNKTKTSINRLRLYIDKIDNFFVSKLNDTTFSNFSNLHRQSVLNTLHKVWVKKQLENPMYTQLLEKVNLLYWQVTCECFFTPDEWKWFFKESSYTGDYSFIYFE